MNTEPRVNDAAKLADFPYPAITESERWLARESATLSQIRRTQPPPGNSKRKASQRRHGSHDATHFGEPFQPSDSGIAWETAFAGIVQKFMAVIWPEGDAPTRITGIFAPLLVGEHRLHDAHHIGIAAEMVGLMEGAVGFLFDIAQVDKMGAGCKPLSQGANVVARPGTE